MEKMLGANETWLFRRDPGRHWVLGIRALIVGALALLSAGCVSTDEASPAVSASAPSVTPAAAGKEPTRTVYGTTVPARGKFILVNIPSFELVALQDGVPVLRSRVVVGRPESPTPELLSSMYAIKFNPSWTPTPWMIRNEAAHYIPPGPQNPLGRILFELDNDQLIFLHDTNQKELFARERRAFSHGCVRVEQARQLAAWALGVSGKEIDQMISHGGTYSVPLPDPIPVSLIYSTQFPDKDGQTVLHPDIYPGHVAQARSLSVRPASTETAHLGCEAAAG
jgi:murein L,D-transpeptidase YcbB/YkuD